jgi:folylpolyglutamate synthase
MYGVNNNSNFKYLKSSPHLIEVRERIKINGESLSYKKFIEYFSFCHKKLIQDAVGIIKIVVRTKQHINFKINFKIYECESQKPIYFQFLTCMMFYAFLKEKVDVAIIEVGLGGEYDSTNIIR